MSRTDFIRHYTPPSRQPAIAQLRAVDAATMKPHRCVVRVSAMAARIAESRLQLRASHSPTTWVLFGTCLWPPRVLSIAIEKTGRTGHSEHPAHHEPNADD
jgi:hypothetical protein